MPAARAGPQSWRRRLAKSANEPVLKEPTRMSAEQRATDLKIDFPVQQPGYLNLCIQSGNQLITSGHVSDMKGKVGAGRCPDLPGLTG
jgi:hypothetical protein